MRDHKYTKVYMKIYGLTVAYFQDMKHMIKKAIYIYTI